MQAVSNLGWSRTLLVVLCSGEHYFIAVVHSPAPVSLVAHVCYHWHLPFSMTPRHLLDFEIACLRAVVSRLPEGRLSRFLTSTTEGNHIRVKAIRARLSKALSVGRLPAIQAASCNQMARRVVPGDSIPVANEVTSCLFWALGDLPQSTRLHSFSTSRALASKYYGSFRLIPSVGPDLTAKFEVKFILPVWLSLAPRLGIHGSLHPGHAEYRFQQAKRLGPSSGNFRSSRGLLPREEQTNYLPTIAVSPSKNSDILTEPQARAYTSTRSVGCGPDDASSKRALRRASPAPIPLHLYPNPSSRRKVGIRTGPVSTSSDLDSVPLDFDYMATCVFARFDPTVQGPSNLDVLFELGQLWGAGVTRAQFVQLWRRCARCHKLCFVERRRYHDCKAAAWVLSGEQFDIVGAALSCQANSGVALAELSELLRRCTTCGRIGVQRALHECQG
ncbi:hypothetical protein NMY22_g10960 [Coprinellus aureogranulatus]|nr:hypothetical protein NMY22_g10960 [Coprinellus aureogranulatus]